jgi:predicted MFS family arabinose efflux permease
MMHPSFLVLPGHDGVVHNSVISCSVTPSLSIASRISGSRSRCAAMAVRVRTPGQVQGGWHNGEVERKTMGARPWFILAAVALARIGFGYQYQTVASLGPDLMRVFQSDYTTLGILIGAFMMSGAFVALPIGLLARRLGDRLVLAGGLALMVLGPIISALANAPTGIGVGRGAAGTGAVAVIVLQNKIIADWFMGQRFMWAISVSVAAYPIGVGLAQLVLPPVALVYGWRAAFLSDAVPMAVSLALFLATFRPSPHAAPTPHRFMLPGGRECLLLVIAGLTWTAYTAGYSGYTAYVPSLMASRGEGLVLTGLVLTIATWGNVPATLLGSGLAARFGGFRVFMFGTSALVIGMTGAALWDYPVTWAVVIGIFGSFHPGVIMAVGTLSARPENRAVGMGLFYTVYYAGGALVPPLCGWAADIAGGLEGALLTAAVVAALAAPMYLLHRRLSDHMMVSV